MATLGELRLQLFTKGYIQTSSDAAQQIEAAPITVHLHPLITNPVVLIGSDGETAREYQTTLVAEAIKRR